MVPLKWYFGEFFPSVAAAFLCIALGRLGEVLEPGVHWSENQGALAEETKQPLYYAWVSAKSHRYAP